MRVRGQVSQCDEDTVACSPWRQRMYHVVHTPLFNRIAGTTLILTFLSLAYRHAQYILEYGFALPIALYLAMELTVIVLVLVRSPPRERSVEVEGWVVAFVGTFLSLLLVPSPDGVISAALGTGLIVTGCVLAILAYLSLNTSFGVLPANRGIQTRGLYAVVRHPMYAAYFFVYVGYLLIQFSWYNLMLISIVLLCQVLRTVFEERFLLADEQYRTYRARVPWRFFPYLV